MFPAFQIRALSRPLSFRHAFVISCQLFLFGQALFVSGESPWPQFRGPHGDGVIADCNVPLDIGENKSLIWKTSLSGRAWSSPVVADDTIWMTTALEVFPTEAEQKEMMREAGIEERQIKQKKMAKAIELKLLAVDFKSGELRSTIDLVQVATPDAIHALNSYASPTPVIDGDFIYCHFGTYGTFCVERSSGQIVWKRQLKLEHSVGPGSSPFIDGPRLVLIQDGVERQYVAALDKESGKTIWEVDRPEMDAPTGDQKKAYCTPIKITDNTGRDQLVCMASQWMVAYEPETGKEIWKVRHGKGFSVVPRPVFDGECVYFSTGFGKPQLWAVRVDGSGDVTDTHVKWTIIKGISKKPSPVVKDGLIYVMDDTGIASCFETATGDLVWKKRIGGNYSASPLMIGQRIYFGSHDGKVTVVKAGRQGEVLAESQLDGQIMASPAVVGDSLVVRTDQAVYRFQ